MIPIPFDENARYTIVDVQGKRFLFTNMRIDRDTVPEGMHAYDVGDEDCDGNFHRIQRFVLVNHWGTIIGAHALELDEYGQHWPEEGTDEFYGDFADESMTLAEYLAGEDALIQ